MILLVGCADKGLPDSFTLKLFGDYTSSGGTRHYNAEIVFDDDQIVSAWQKYEAWEGSGDHKLYSCYLETGSNTWLDNQTDGECEQIPNYLADIPLTKQGIQQKIDSGEYAPEGKKTSREGITYKIIE